MSRPLLTRIVPTLLVLVVGVVAASPALAATNLISTVAGTGVSGFFGDGGPATAARINVPTEVTATSDGGFLIADQSNSRVRRVSPNGTITTIAGNGTIGAGGNGGPATSAQLNAPNGVVRMPDGSVLIADSNNNVVRRVAGGIITVVAGTGAAGFNGDGAATTSQLSFPVAVAATPDGGYLIADNDNHRIRRVSPSGTMTTVAGTGTPTFGGDGAAATAAQLNDPSDVAVLPDGGYVIADLLNQRVRRVSPGGTITTVAGTGTAGFGGDGGAATAATLSSPINVASTGDGGFLINDRANNRIRKVTPGGTISTVAGTGVAGFTGDGVLATASRVNQPIGLDVTSEGDYLIADSLNHRIRLVDAAAAPVTPPPVTPPVSIPLPPPVLGRRVNVQLVRGRVLIAVPAGSSANGSVRASQKGLKFVPLRGSQQIPVRSFLDTKRGTVRLLSATRTGSRGFQSGEFSRGLFQVLQSGKSSARGLTELRLKGSSLRSCRRTSSKKKASSSARRRRSKRAIRRLRGNAKGRFRTRGRYSAATVRGTIWTTTDRCDGTLTKVSQGRVAVRDFRRKKTVSVRRGKSYLARAPG